MDERREAFERKRADLFKKCSECITQNAYFKPSADCCDECTIGRRLRFLEAEYSDVTGWSHSKW